MTTMDFAGQLNMLLLTLTTRNVILDILILELSRRDDLESMIYTLFEFLLGKLPWHMLSDVDHVAILKKQMSSMIENNFYNFPSVIVSAYQYIRSLEFEETPNYEFLKEIFLAALIELDGFGPYTLPWYNDKAEQNYLERVKKLQLPSSMNLC